MMNGPGCGGWWLRETTALLRRAGVDSPGLDAELLLACVLGCERSQVLAQPQRMLTNTQATRLQSLARRRADREPLAYILGRREFFGIQLTLDRRVLVPRPETEELVERALAWLHARGEQVEAGERIRIADVGTGCGAIAIAISCHYPGAIIYATDISLDALTVAQGNVCQFGLLGQVFLVACDLLEPLAGGLDLILANLPYIASGELSTLMPEVSQYEPPLALDGGPDGLTPLRRLLNQGQSRLQAGGAMMLEIGAGQGPSAAQAAGQVFPHATVGILPDLAGHDRFLIVQAPGGQCGCLEQLSAMGSGR